MSSDLGESMYKWAEDLFPICRSLTGPGVRQTLAYLQGLLPGLSIHEVPSGTVAFDWAVPNEWIISEAFVENESGVKVIDFRNNNLHVVGYSCPIDKVMSLEELQPHLHSIPAQAKAIPYVTSYYENNWGFCISQEERNCLRPGNYRVCIQSELMAGAMSYGELILPGRDETEILLSTYVCHPSMANNELSGPVVTTALARWLMELDRRHTYRIIFIPETIGSILYLSLNLKHLQECVVAGFVMTCIGDTRAYSFLRSRKGSSLADRVAKHVLKYHAPNYIEYSFLDRGSDERQFCSPGVDLPVVSIMRSKYHCYPEYHTSLDDLSLISPSGLLGGFEAMQKCLRILESNYFYRATLLCEPQLGRRGLYPTMSTSTSGVTVRDLKNILAYSDGSLDLIDLAETIGISALDCIPLLNKLALAGLIDHS